MTPLREPSAVVAAWLEDGPNELPESTRRAIAVDVRTTPQSRRASWFPWRFPTVDRLSLVALAAAAVMVVAIAGLAVSRIATDGANVGGPPPAPPASPSPSPPASPSPSPSEAPSAAPIPTTLVIPVMSDLYTSRLHGYSILYPADWSVEEARVPWSPPAWKVAGSPQAPLDVIGAWDSPMFFRAGSAPLPQDLPDVNGWIDEYLTFGDPSCVPPRESQEEISIDGAPGRVRDSCGEVEATIVLEGRVYMFTLFTGGAPVANGRELFDALAVTIDLRPEDAEAPGPSPS
jgi:hypothetical protein